jgi:DNA invertase Pin-like site-specific DNA recombinase
VTNKGAGYYRISVARDDMKAPSSIATRLSVTAPTMDCGFPRCSRTSTTRVIGAPSLAPVSRRSSCATLSSLRCVPKPSRFGRSVRELVELFDLFDNKGVALVFLNIDTATSHVR